MEFTENASVSLHLSDLSLIEDVRSENYKHIQLFKHRHLGKVLILDGEIQHVEAWSPIYHETLVHVPLAFVKQAQVVLILGGGCFYAAKEVLKYKSVRKVIMIDHDTKVVDMMRRNYEHVEKVFADPRFILQIQDAFVALEKLQIKFDLIINDSIDLLSHSLRKKTKIFNKLSSFTTKDGVCADLIYRHIFEKQSTKKTINFLHRNKLKSVFSLVAIPEYPGILHLLSIWGKSKNLQQETAVPFNEIQNKWLKRSALNPCEYYNPAFLSYYLYLPPYLKRINDGSNYF